MNKLQKVILGIVVGLVVLGTVVGLLSYQPQKGLTIKFETKIDAYGEIYNRFVKVENDFVVAYNANMRGLVFGSYRTIRNGFWRTSTPMEIGKWYTVEITYSGTGEPIIKIDGVRQVLIVDSFPLGEVGAPVRDTSKGGIGSIFEIKNLFVRYVK